MNTEARSYALKKALSEIKNVCPHITTAFIFGENAEILAEDQNTTQEAINNAQEAFISLAQNVTILGGIESVSFRGEESRLNITRFENLCVANVASNEIDEKTVANLTNVLIPTTVKLFSEIDPPKNVVEPTLPKAESECSNSETSPPQPQACQLTVENIGFGAFLKDPYVVFIDRALIAQWGETFGDRQITAVLLEEPTTGKILSCPFKPFKESRYEGKGIVQLSEKNRLSLNVQRGSQILIKPKIDKLDNATSPPDGSNQPSQNIINTKPNYFGDAGTYVPNAPVCQLIVEDVRNLGSFLGNNEFARVDNGILARWKELFPEKHIEKITIEEIKAGRKVSCQFKLMKGSELEGKGIIQLSEKIQRALQTKKGALVLVKPEVE